MKEKKLSEEEIADILKCKDILGKIGCESLLNIKQLTDLIGISRKSAYEYKKKYEESSSPEVPASLETVLEENQLLKDHISQIELEVQGLRITKMALDELKKK